MFVTQYLNFDMFWIFNIFFYENSVNPERFFRFAFCASVFLQQVFFIPYNTHTASATAGRCFQNQRISAYFSVFLYFLFIFSSFFYPRNGWYTNRCSYNFGLNFIAQCVHHFMGRPNERNSCFFTLLCEISIFRQEAIAWMNGINRLCFCQFNNFTNAQISINR